MPARAGTPMAPRSPMKGGRRTSLGGGNRGECQDSGRQLQDYGDWMRNNAAATHTGATLFARTKCRSTKRLVRSTIRRCKCMPCRTLSQLKATPVPANRYWTDSWVATAPSDACVGHHGGTGFGGGARMACPRTQVSRMTMTAPQCVQTKLGRIESVSVSASACEASVMTAGTTPSSSRALARLSLRPWLAISPKWRMR